MKRGQERREREGGEEEGEEGEGEGIWKPRWERGWTHVTRLVRLSARS